MRFQKIVKNLLYYGLNKCFYSQNLKSKNRAKVNSQ